MKRPLYITLYDYSTCFDSLWLEDTMLSLWEIGLQNQFLPLLYNMNKDCHITIRTPYGFSEEFSCPSIVKQGAVLSTSLCGSSTGRISKKLQSTNHCGTSIGSSNIHAVLFVDDTATTNSTTLGSIESHKTVVSFANAINLSINAPKCAQLIINNPKNDAPPLLLVDNKIIPTVDTSKYLGDIFAANGTNNPLIIDRVNKGKTIIITALSICNDVTLGNHYIRSALILYQCVFLASVLFNCQSWSNLTQTQIKNLRTVQLKFLKRIMQAPNATPNCFVFLELAVLPIEYEIHRRQLAFLHHILNLPESNPVHQQYLQQLSFSFEPNWANNIKQLLCTYDLDHIDIKSLTKHTWRCLVKSKITKLAFDNLTTQSANQSKTHILRYDSFLLQKYILSAPDVASFIFRVRGRMLNCRDNQHRHHPNITCRHCYVEIENQDHIVNCRSIFPNEQVLSTSDFFSSNFDPDITTIKQIMRRYDDYLTHANS